MIPRGGARIGAGRKPASTTGKPNGRRVNVYLTPANFETWRGLPDGKRSEYVNTSLAEVDRLRAELEKEKAVHAQTLIGRNARQVVLNRIVEENPERYCYGDISNMIVSAMAGLEEGEERER